MNNTYNYKITAVGMYRFGCSRSMPDYLLCMYPSGGRSRRITEWEQLFGNEIHLESRVQYMLYMGVNTRGNIGVDTTLYFKFRRPWAFLHHSHHR